MSERRKVLELFEQQKDYTKKRVSEGIEKYRKGNAEIIITDKDGNPVNGAKIRVKQKNHEFRFGANVFMIDGFETKEKNEEYEKRVAEVFNMATLPFYWDALEPKKGNTRYGKDSVEIYRRPPIDRCIEFCEKYGIEPREHALAYERFFPEWLYGASVDEIKKAFENRCAEISERYADKINTIEVTNEMVWEEGRTAFYDESDYIEWCFKIAEKYFPNNRLGINEWVDVWKDVCRSSNRYYAQIEANLLKGARIDAIGLQFHLFNSVENEYDATRKYLNPENLYKHMDLFSELGKPLQITEVTVPAYSWNEEDEDIQAEIIENLYSIWFSHKNVEQIIYWNLIDGYCHVDTDDKEVIMKSQGNMKLGENYFHGGLLRFDMSPKPAYYKIKELTKKVWHTDEEIVTNNNGTAAFRGFYGDYDVEIIADGKTYIRNLKLSSKKDNIEKIIL